MSTSFRIPYLNSPKLRLRNLRTASNFGFKPVLHERFALHSCIASTLRRFGWPDEAVVFALATLPVIELRGAIPVGYWMQLKPTVLTFFSVLGLVS
ncbi:unnamed protein product [Arabidopsis arenosa]|uniref:Uncharacterized protein n=1 Tax=Arabidopsis arenosa TaxID=38785 RepID=A0A8S2A9F2_ARAAE|nr:unnamed protein product [Arabidopsis arenosa]